MSLAARLNAFFLVAVGLLLGAFSGTLYLLARTHLHREVDESLVLVLDQIASTVVDRSGMVGWRPGRWTPTPGLHGGVELTQWAIFDDQRVAIDDSWDLTRGDEARVLALIPPVGHDHLTITAEDGRNWRLAVRRLAASPSPSPSPSMASPMGEDDEADEADEPDEEDVVYKSASSKDSTPVRSPYLDLATATPLDPVESSLRLVAMSLAAGSIGLWSLAALLGRQASRRALRPMTRMSTVARTMSAADRGQHLPSPGTRDELEELAQSFNGLIDRLHEALARQHRFTGDASHQLRSPLTALIGEIEVARRRDRSPEDYRQILDEVHDDALRLGQIVEALLFLARGEADAGHPGLVPVDLARWVRDHLRDAPERDQDVQIVADGGRYPVQAHPALLGQLLDNLIDNAAKYGPPGGPIVVRLARETGRVELAVEDRGPGIRPEDLQHLFEPFFRSEEARRLGRPGVGLGLAVVQRIASSIGGEVIASNLPGGGARFAARFPEYRHDLDPA